MAQGRTKMFLELIATIIAGIAAAGIVMIANKMLGGRLPKWLMPVGAGAAMIAMTISNEYGWFPRTKAALPEGLIVVEKVESKALYRPWTYLHPYVERFAALDATSVKTHKSRPGQKLADIYYFGRWAPVHKLPVLSDCAGARRAALTDGISFGSDGQIEGVAWVKVDASDPTLAAICGAG